MIYRCEDCGNTFPEPEEHRFWDPRPDGALEPMRIVVCPWCGSGWFHLVDEYAEDEE